MITVKKILALLLLITLGLGLCGNAMAQTVTFGTDQYMPLQWRVLKSTEQYTKLITVDCIDCRSFGSTSDWATSSLRSWLNNVYLYSAFSYEERNAICLVENDMIRLPSVWDMTNPEYGFSSNQDAQDRSRSAGGTATAINNGLWLSELGYCSYYTLTPCDRTSMYQIRSTGSVGVARVDRDNVGVRLVIVVRTDALQMNNSYNPNQVSPYF